MRGNGLRISVGKTIKNAIIMKTFSIKRTAQLMQYYWRTEKKLLAVIMTVAMALSLAACGGKKDYGSGEIKVWVADAVVDFTKKTIDEFMAANPQYAGYTVTVEAVGEGDAASNVITDVTAGADIYGFAQDQTARLVAAGALEEVAPENVDAIKNENAAGAVVAATVGDTLYAYPMTADNGYFMFYDSSVFTEEDVQSLDSMIAAAEAAAFAES